jgi:glycerol-3-phosphate acyltransferase PlsY
VSAPVAAVLVLALLLGSLPFSWIVARVFGVRDVRAVGSGNVGATNVMRSAGKLPGVLAFLLDFLMGALASWIAVRWIGGARVPAMAAVLAVLGHMYPPWLAFRGGKGVATGAGAFVPLAPGATGLALLAFPLVLAGTRYVSVASLAGGFTLAAAAWALGAPIPVALAATAMALFITWKHRANLQRLLKGTEHRVGERKADEETDAEEEP